MFLFRRSREDEVQRQIKRLGIKSKPYEVRAAMSSLEEIGERAVLPLIQVLLDQNELPIVRCRVAGTLAFLKDERAVEPLIETLVDENVEVRWHAVQALAKLGNRRAIPELQRIADNDEGEFTVTPTLHIVIKDDAKKAIEKIESFPTNR
jgi:HEAT repeat protein